MRRFASMMPLCAVCLTASLAPAQPPVSAPGATAPPVLPPAPDGFRVRAGYRVNVAIAHVPGARFLEVDDKGTLFVSRLGMGDILACRDENSDGVYEKQSTFIADKPKVQGMCFRSGEGGGWLWFSTDGAIYKARDTDADGVADEVVDVIPPGQLPLGGQHLWRSLLVTKDSIYTSIGDGGNISDQMATDREKIWRFDLHGTNKRLFASGLRNTEKLGVRPGSEEIWGFDHGSDNFGIPFGDVPPNDQPITDLNPPEELNLYVQDGFYGHPFIVGDRIPRQEYKDRPDLHALAARTIPPEFKLGAHWACNGWCFVDPEVNRMTGGLPLETSGDIFVACHGSWNSSVQVGYCIARVLFDDGKPYGLLKIVDTLQKDTGKVLARPVDCVQAPDGSIIFSSDQPGRIYRITRDPDPKAKP